MGKFSRIKTLQNSGDSDPVESGAEMAIALIHPSTNQPRKHFDQSRLDALVLSVREQGILEPLLVRPIADGFEIVAGERRYRAAQIVGLKTVPVVVKDVGDREAFEIALIENLQREDLNPIEETEGVLGLLSLRLGIELGQVQALLHTLVKDSSNVTRRAETEEVLEQLGINLVSFATNRLPILRLPDDVQDAIRKGLEYTKARAIARVKNDEQRQILIEKALTENLSLTQIKELIKGFSSGGAVARDAIGDRVQSVLKKINKAKLEQMPGAKRRQLEGYLEKIEQMLGD
jgi:ParB family chromosome partitioning protein